MTISSIFKFWEEFLRLAWFSVSSTDFYSDLYKKYKGYGIKYITMVISITSIIYAVVLFNNITNLKYYLKNTVLDNNPIEHILRQWPEVNYDGMAISMEDPAPVLISNIKGRVILAIDIDNNLSDKQKRQIPVIFVKDKIIIRFQQMEDAGEKNNNFTLTYDMFLGKELLTLDYNSLRSKLLFFVDPIGIGTLLILIPLSIVTRLALHIVRNMVSMVILFAALWFMNMKPTAASVSRVVLFTSAFAELIFPILLIFIPQAIILGSLVEYWAIILSLVGLFRIRNYNSK